MKVNKKKILIYLSIFVVFGVVGVGIYAYKDFKGKVTDEDLNRLLLALKNPAIQGQYDYLSLEELKQKNLSKSDVEKIVDIANKGTTVTPEDVEFVNSKLSL